MGGAVWILAAGGGGGTNGMFSGRIVVSELGVAGDGVVGDTEATGPGAGGVGPFAVWLCEPGSTIVSESWMLGLVLGSGFFVSAKDLYRRMLAQQ